MHLAAELNVAENSAFFDGVMTAPWVTARCLRALSNLVGTRFYIPPGMLAKILREADPVVTIGQDKLRFEGFSACYSAYARHDILEDGFEVDQMRPGTTNVDFQADMRAALAKIRSNSSLRMEVNADQVVLESGDSAVIEKKVPLPARWIKGFAEAQSYLANMEQRFTLNTVQAQRFLRSLPRASSNQEQWLVPAGPGVRLASRRAKGGVALKGANRLRVLETLANDAKSLTVYGSDEHNASAWVLDFGSQRFNLVLSPEPWRGFSGEGQLLDDLSREGEGAVAAIKAQLAWQTEIDADAVGEAAGKSPAQIRIALAQLASRGVLGYDLANQAYFHRVLPFDPALIAGTHPRLLGANKLIEQKAVKLSSGTDETTAEVSGSGVIYIVTITADGHRCTCPWYAKHRNERGACKHILATQMLMEKL